MSEVLDWLSCINVSTGSNVGTDLTNIRVGTSDPNNFVVRANCALTHRQVIAIDYPITIVNTVNSEVLEALTEKFGSSSNRMMVKLWATKLLLDGNEAILKDLYPRTTGPEDLNSVYYKLMANMFQTLGGGQHIFSTFTFINHSCTANSIIIPTDNDNYKLIALRDIAPDEEITQDYIGISFTNRKAEIKNSYGFDCKCGSCDHPNPGCKFLLQNKACWSCRAPNPKQRCSKCKVTPYCSATCQRKDWSKHKISCDMIGKIFTYDVNDPNIIPEVNIERLQELYC